MRQVNVEHNYYEILGVERDAPLHIIRSSFRRLMQQAGNHPDLGGDTQTAALLNKAYAVLKDPALRQDYDARLDILARVTVGLDVESAPAPFDLTKQCAFCGQPHDFGEHASSDDHCENCGSPLQNVERRRFESGDLRAVQRLNKELDTVVFTHWQQQRGFAAKTEDISPQGLRLVTLCDVRRGQRVRLSNNVLEAVGEITHCAPRRGRWLTETVAGVSFHTLRFKKSTGRFVSRSV